MSASTVAGVRRLMNGFSAGGGGREYTSNLASDKSFNVGEIRPTNVLTDADRRLHLHNG